MYFQDDSKTLEEIKEAMKGSYQNQEAGKAEISEEDAWAQKNRSQLLVTNLSDKKNC